MKNVRPRPPGLPLLTSTTPPRPAPRFRALPSTLLSNLGLLTTRQKDGS
jgi:hypothetical protein